MRIARTARQSVVALALVAAAGSGCAGGQSPAASTGLASAAPSSPAPSTASPSATPVPALVGSWVGEHDCQRIADMLLAADMPEQVLPNIVDNRLLPGASTVDDVEDPANPCEGAVGVEHSHFFTADGQFGSRDASGEQVDDNRWSIVDDDTFAIGDVQFRYEIEGDELRMQPVTVGTCPPGGAWCEEAWKLMVAMPGTAWVREQ